MFGAKIDNNPSPGNKAGGLTTIYEKSLGAWPRPDPRPWWTSSRTRLGSISPA